jgi:hypothetical protein
MSTRCILVRLERFPNWCLELSPVVILEEFKQPIHECPIAKRFQSCKWNPVEQTIMPMHRLVIEIRWAAGAWQLDIPKWFKCVTLETISDIFDLSLAFQGFPFCMLTSLVCRHLVGVVALGIRRNYSPCMEPEHPFTCSLELVTEPCSKPKYSNRHPISLRSLTVLNRAFCRAVSGRSLTTEARVQFQAS